MKFDDLTKLPYTYDLNTELQKVLKETRDMQVKVCAENSNDQRDLLSQPDQRFQSHLSFVPVASQG